MTQLKQIVEHFHGQTPTDADVAAFCEQQSFDAISAGELEDWTFQYDVDKTRNELVPLIGQVLVNWTPASEFDSVEVKEASIKKLQADILALIEERDIRFDIAYSALKNIASIGTVISNVTDVATDKKVAVANAFIIQHFGKMPDKVGVGSYAQLCKKLAEQGHD